MNKIRISYFPLLSKITIEESGSIALSAFPKTKYPGRQRID